MDEDLHPGGEGVDAGYADAVEAAGDLVVLLVELAAGVELGHDQLEGGDVLLGMEAYGDAAAVVLDPNDVVLLEDDEDVRAVAGEGLIDGVVDDFVDEVVEAIDARGPDIHAGALSDRLETFKYLNAIRRIG
jgi:hypothetical protein